MKTTRSKYWLAVGLSVLTATAAYRGSAAEASPNRATAKPDKTYTGTVVSVNPQENLLDVKGFLFSKKEFNLGNNCVYTMVGRNSGAMGDLRPGQRVTVGYQDAHGVLIADRVTQQPMRDKGRVKAIDPAAHKLTLHLGFRDKSFQLPAGCAVTLYGGRSGTLSDIQPGEHVTVTYEVPDGKATAREIAQTSVTFTGDLTAIDLDQKTLKAKATFASMKFSVGDDCAIVIHGKPDGTLSDLRPGESLTFSYNAVNGVNIVNRIAPAGAPKGSIAASSSPMNNN
jgi:Cu/Ag efflux protein CusF